MIRFDFRTSSHPGEKVLSYVSESSQPKASLPPVEWNDAKGFRKCATIEFLGELGNHDHPLNQRLVVNVGFQLDCRVAPSSLSAADIVGGLGIVENTPQPKELASQLHVTVDDLCIGIGVEHHSCPAADDLITVAHQMGDFVLEPPTSFGIYYKLANRL